MGSVSASGKFVIGVGLGEGRVIVVSTGSTIKKARKIRERKEDISILFLKFVSESKIIQHHRLNHSKRIGFRNARLSYRLYTIAQQVPAEFLNWSVDGEF